MRRLCWLAGWLLIAWLGAPAPAAATLYLWQGPNAGSWTEPTNWNPSTGFPNSANDIALIQPGPTPLVIAVPSGAYTLRQLAITSAGGNSVAIVGVNATLTLIPQGTAPAIISDSNSHLIQVPIVLGGNAIVDVPDGTLTFQLTVGESGGARTFTKKGAGTAIFTSPISYTGGTTIQEGTLRLTQANIMPDAGKVEVRADANFEPQQSDTIGNLTIANGDVDMSTGILLSVSSLDMAGGNINTSGTATLALRGNVTMTSSGPVVAFIGQFVTISMENATRTFTVPDGPVSGDAVIRGPIVGPTNDPAVGLIKDGAGSLDLSTPGPSLYTGLTWVKQGRLVLERKVPADLRVGDGVGPAREAVAYPVFVGTINAQRAVVVESDGLFDLVEGAETFDQLTINGGTMTPGNHVGSVAVRSLVMNGGVIDTGNPGTTGSLVRLQNVPNVRLQATSTASQTSFIRGTGRLVLDGSPDFIVNDGPQQVDLRIDMGIVSNNQGLKKSGPGLALFGFDNQYPGATNLSAGTLMIDGTQPSAINLTGGTLSGIGRTGAIVGAAGTIAPGHSPGILGSLDVALAAGVTFAPELNGTTVASTYDQLKVTGTVALNNATLAPVIASNVTLPQNATLRIIDNDGTDAVTGTFANLAEGATVIADRHVFLVSYRGGDGNDVVLTVTTATEPPPPPTPGALLYYLAEGATGGFFDEDVAIANPTDNDAPVTLTFLQEGGGTVVDHRTVPKQTRVTVHVDQIAGLENASPSVQVESDQKVPLIVERTMYWDSSYYGGHTANAVAKPETKWILAEGFQGFFDTYLLIANANATETTATVTFLRENESPVVKTIPIAAFARKTIYAGDFSELLGRAFGMVVEATQPVIAERSMYFASIPGRLWTGGHVNTGVTAPSTSWFHAEGATGGFFNTFILLSNPQTTEAHIELRFLLEDGTTIVKSKTLPAGQRLTVNPAAEGDPRLENAAMSTIVASDVPIVSERSMYWPGDATPFGEGHNSSGVVATATRWGLAEGRIGAPRNFTTYILLANPTTTAADVTVTYLRESGAPVTKTYTVAPTSRFNIDVAGAVPELHDESFGARIEVTNGVPIAVERSVYWDANGIFWAGGTNALATPLP